MPEKNKEIDSEGEEIIKEFFEEKDIKYKKQVKIEDLDGDHKPYRIADFYLPGYKVYVEFLGGWNHEERRKEYNRKKWIYSQNKKPCIYLYPDNLGVLNFIFKRRLKKELKKYNLKWQLFKCNWRTFLEENGISLFLFGSLAYYLEATSARILFAVLFLVYLIKSIKNQFLQ